MFISLKDACERAGIKRSWLAENLRKLAGSGAIVEGRHFQRPTVSKGKSPWMVDELWFEGWLAGGRSLQQRRKGKGDAADAIAKGSDEPD